MKTLVRMLMCLACVAVLSSCEKDPEFSGTVNLDELKNFDANFIVQDFTLPDAPILDGGCLKTWKGFGESYILGQFSVEMNLLCDIENLRFCYLIGTFHAQDGSAIFFNIAEGEYACNLGKDCVDFQYSFNEPAVILGGTGRFAGATGGFHTNALIHNGEIFNWFAKFSCKGDIKLRPENQENQPGVGPLIPEPIP